MGFSRLSSEFYCRWATKDDSGLDDDSLVFALELIRWSGYGRVLFYDREDCPEPAEWIAFCRAENKLFFMLYDGDCVPVSAVWFEKLTNTGRQAFAHFCTFRTGCYDQFVRGGRALLRFVGENTPVRQAIGVTPACFRHALKIARDLGFVKAARLEKAVWCLGKERDAILTIHNLLDLRG